MTAPGWMAAYMIGEVWRGELLLFNKMVFHLRLRIVRHPVFEVISAIKTMRHGLFRCTYAISRKYFCFFKGINTFNTLINGGGGRYTPPLWFFPFSRKTLDRPWTRGLNETFSTWLKKQIARRVNSPAVRNPK